MGYRTVVVIENDVLGSRETFIKNAGELYDTIISNGRIKCQVGRVIEQVHNDNVTLCIHGGGSGRDVCVAQAHWSDKTADVTLLKVFATKLGYRVSKRPA